MSHDQDKLIRQLSLLSFLLSRRRPFTAREVQESVEGYAEMSDETFARRFSGDRADLAKIGIPIRVLVGAEATGGETQLYLLPEEDFRLPGVDFTATERRALSIALAALDGRFAYARPLRLALTAILRGRHDPVRDELDRLPIALAPDEDALRAGKQLSRLEHAVSRGKTVCFSYPSAGGNLEQRTLDPYSLFLIQGRWYVVGHDHDRGAIRTFRLGRMRGSVRFLTEKARDFSIPGEYDPEEYRARPPWLIGPVQGRATIRVGDDLAWWVKRLEPHVRWLADDDEGCALFSVPYADESVLLSWAVGLGVCGELLEPPGLRERMKDLLAGVGRAHTGTVDDGDLSQTGRDGRDRPAKAGGAQRLKDKTAPIAPEHLARAIALLSYLVDEERPALVTWRDIEDDLGLTRSEVESDLSLINLVNFGGGTYALTAEAGPNGVDVVRDVMADAFSQPARLSPVMARALLLALDLLGDAFALEGLESLASVRQKVRALVGADGSDVSVIVDEVVPPDPEIVKVLNLAIRDQSVVTLEYFTSSRQELSERLVEPYLLFHSPEGWYLEGYCLLAQGQRTFKLERIRSARPTATSFVPRAEIDLTRRRAGEAFFPDEACTWATIRFHPRWRTYLDDGATDYRERPDGDLEAWMPYADERWVALEVVRFLGEAVLLEPISARRRIEELARVLAVRYEKRCPSASARPPAPSRGGP